MKRRRMKVEMLCKPKLYISKTPQKSKRQRVLKGGARDGYRIGRAKSKM